MKSAIICRSVYAYFRTPPSSHLNRSCGISPQLPSRYALRCDIDGSQGSFGCGLFQTVEAGVEVGVKYGCVRVRLCVAAWSNSGNKAIVESCDE